MTASFQDKERVVLNRDCEVVAIPDGYKMTLKKGTDITIYQSLGGNYTVVTEMGHMVRIDGKDADCIGKEVSTYLSPSLVVDKESVEKEVWTLLKTIYDPEIPVNVVDLGLIYTVVLKEIASEQFSIDIKMTVTAPGCGMGNVLHEDVKSKLKSIKALQTINVELVFDPPWDRSMMSEAAKLQLGF